MQSSASRGTPIGAVIVIVGGALLAVGSFLTWLSVSGEGIPAESATGIDGSDGWYSLVAGVVAIAAGLLLTRQGRRALATLAVIAGLIGGGVGAYDALTVRDQLSSEIADDQGVPKDLIREALDQAIDQGLLELSMGIGLYLVIGGGVLAIVGGFLSMGRAKAPSMPFEAAPAVSTPTPAEPPSMMPPAAPSEPSPPPPAPPAPPPAP